MSVEHAVSLRINGRETMVAEGTTVAVAVLQHTTAFRHSVSGQLRGPVCGMGVCFECRVSIDGRPHQRSCQILCRSGMEVCTDAR